ncbi:glycosyltransferase [Flavobacteriaceae bacterium D16]|nr:glycosyltransferase [Flavobacteriaceae bacterium D16]
MRYLYALIKVPYTLKKLLFGLLKKLKFLPPAFYVKIYYEYYTGKKLNLRQPKEFNEKIQWLKVYYKNPLLTKLVDKYSVREYVKEKVGDEYLNELLGVYNKCGEVDFDALPDQFVIKGVHGFHFNLIVPDKSQLNRRKARYLMTKWLSKNQYYRGGLEWAYKNVPPRLIAEKFLAEMGKDAINDYKFYCFSGVPRFVQVDRQTEIHSYYDPEWNLLPFTKGKSPLKKDPLEKPENFETMVGLAGKLAGDFPFVRVDLYNIDGKILFGEMTFYPSDGRTEFKPEEYNRILGDYIELPDPMGV